MMIYVISGDGGSGELRMTRDMYPNNNNVNSFLLLTYYHHHNHGWNKPKF